MPLPTLLHTDVSDAHVVCSLAVIPTMVLSVTAAMPMFAPCTVMLADPVRAMFDLCTELIVPSSDEYPSVALDAPMPAVTTARKLPAAACPDLHASDVSEPHDVTSQPVRPGADDAESATSPMLDPWIVTRMDPLPAALARTVMLSKARWWPEYASVALPTPSPIVTETRRLASSPLAALLMAAVSDIQREISLAERPTLKTAEKDDRPTLAPSTVKLADPVAALFDARRALRRAPESEENPQVMLPARLPLVTENARDVPALYPTLQLTDESDSHLETSHAVVPDRTNKLEKAMLDP